MAARERARTPARAVDEDPRASSQDALARRAEADTRYRVLVEHVPAAVYIDMQDPNVTDGGRLLYLSPQIEAILGYPPEAFIDDPELWPSLIHPDDRDIALNAYSEHWSGGQLLRAEYRMYARDGSLVWLRDEAYAMNEGPGKGARLAGPAHRHHRPQAARGAAPPRRAPRPADRAGQPRPVPRAPRAGAPAAAAAGLARRGPVPRPRRLQGGQRLARPSGRRPAPGRGRPSPERRDPGRRHRGPPGRRRVHRAPRIGPGRRRCGRVRRAAGRRAAPPDRARRPLDRRRGERRHRPLERSRHRRRRPARPRRRRDVCREGRRQGRHAVFDPTMRARARSRLETEAELRQAIADGVFELALPADRRPRRRHGWSRSRRSCAGAIRERGLILPIRLHPARRGRPA